ncbi:unnamed protein product [Symbiodinium necroappetens]|uniref:Amine oxidase domain-containing protein n=1 Tax=Symbiodinium necroappetens TaxID=1628268 RepID=A0A812NDK1_9DINO|nr:unnamed protein product [Symbiodinium necroappetens]
MARDTQSSLHGARLTLCTSRGKLATQMGPKNMTLPQPGKPFFDYGCQYISVSSDWFVEELELWKKLGFCQVLPPSQVGTISGSQGFQGLPGDCWVGNGGMAPMLRNIHRQTAQEFEDVLEQVSGFPNDAYKVVGLRKDTSGQWELQMQGGGTLGPFTYVVGGFAQHILTDPFLLSGGAACSAMLECLRRVESNQLIVMQVSFEGEPLPIPFTAAHVCDDEALSFIGNNSQKPQQNGEWGTPGPQQLTLLSTAEFAEREFNCNPKGYRRKAEEKLLAALGRLLKLDVLKYKPQINRINHWEDGLPTNTPPASRGCLFDAKEGLGWCGDFCVAPGVEGAARSGAAMADVLASFHGQKDFCGDGLLPMDVDWVSISSVSGFGIVDIGAFPGVPSRCTHTDHVPSAIGGYDKAKAHFGHVGAAKGYNGKGKDYQSKGGKGKGKGGKGKGSLWKGK